MKKILKKEVIIAFIIGLIIASSITVYAYSYFSNQVGYTTNKNANIENVEQALNDLYNKSNKTPTQVATLTTQGESYKFLHNGYITGTASPTGDSSATLSFDDENYVMLTNEYPLSRYVSVYVPEGITVTTRTDGGEYNLTCYEFK